MGNTLFYYRTPYHLAAEYGMINLIQFFTSLNMCDINIKDDDEVYCFIKDHLFMMLVLKVT